ncbi:MAG: sulfurtransferase [Geminicoccaceae bacterium]
MLVALEELRAASAAALVLDASWLYPPLNSAAIDVRARFESGHIPGAWWLDLADLSAAQPWPDPDVPGITMPSPDMVQAILAVTGYTAADLIVVTDMDGGCTTAPFLRLALRAAGCQRVRLLDGGTPAWQSAGLPMATGGGEIIGAARLSRRPGDAPGQGFGLSVFDDIRRVVDGNATGALIDARMAPTNADILPDRYGRSAIASAAVLRPHEVVEEAGLGLRFRRTDALAQAIESRLGEAPAPWITWCHFGVGAAVVATALEIASFQAVRCYAGSLIDYESRNNGMHS